MRSLIISFVILLGGCSTIPHRWDESQASAITTFRQDVDALDCTQPLGPQLDGLIKELNWFEIYSSYKGTTDIGNMVKTVQGTVQEFAVRERFGSVSPAYCKIKKAIIEEETDVVGHTVKGSLQ